MFTNYQQYTNVYQNLIILISDQSLFQVCFRLEMTRQNSILRYNIIEINDVSFNFLDQLTTKSFSGKNWSITIHTWHMYIAFLMQYYAQHIKLFFAVSYPTKCQAPRNTNVAVVNVSFLPRHMYITV